MPRLRIASAPPRVLLVCSGLDHAHRGFESFARECFEVLSGDPRLDLWLIKGSGAPGPRERSVRTITRDSPWFAGLGRLTGREPFRFEQAAFALSLQPALWRADPDVVYFSEWLTGQMLARLRGVTGGRYRLAFCNGAMAEQGFGHLDLVQQLTPFAVEHVVGRGADPVRQRMLPLGFSIDRCFQPLSAEDRGARRRTLQLPADRPIVLSVAALNRHHKRIDYLIEEVSRLPSPRPFLLMAGQAEPDTPGLRDLARRRLGADGFAMRTVAAGQVRELYRISDAFVLTSLGESFGRVLVEALAEGLPCIAHDYPITRDVLGGHGILTDLSRTGSLADLLAAPLRPPTDAPARHRHAYEQFSWERLAPRYVAFLTEAAGRPASAGQPPTQANRTVSSSSGEELCR
jgi:1,2-diacylglycerol 3-alpha-glucosyltransferase